MKKNIDSFLEYLTVIRNASDNTIAAYRRDLTRFAAEMEERGANSPDQMTEEMVADYFFALERENTAKTTLARHMSSVRAFFRFLVENDDVQRNLTDSLEQPKIRRVRPEILTAEEVDRLLAAPDTKSALGRRDRAILELLYASGLKVGELVALYPDDIDLRSAIVRIRSEKQTPETKGQKGKKEEQREIPFGEKARDALLIWIGQGRDRYVSPLAVAPLFVNSRGKSLSRQSVWKLVRHYADEAGIRKEVSPGMLRHSFAAHLMKNGADARSLTRMLGYTAETQTVIYEDDETLRLRDVYARAQRRG